MDYSHSYLAIKEIFHGPVQDISNSNMDIQNAKCLVSFLGLKIVIVLPLNILKYFLFFKIYFYNNILKR
jgi:hypothetical protein